jgi:hypothetical protein
VAHSMQNLAPARFSVPQLAQINGLPSRSVPATEDN